MKYTIFGVDQIEAVEHGLKPADCVILNWAREIFAMPSSYRMERDGKPYYWLKVDQLLEDYPALHIKKDSLLKKLKSFSNKGFFHKISETVPGFGTFGYYSPTEQFEQLFNNSHKSEKNTGSCLSQMHAEKNAGGLEKNAGGLEKMPAIPSLYNPLINNPPPKTLQNLTEEEEEAFHFLKTKLEFIADETLLILAVKHGTYSVKKIFSQVQKDMNSGRAKSIGVLRSRLDRSEKVQKPVVKAVKAKESPNHIDDCGNKAKSMLKSGFLSSGLKMN